MDLLLLNKCDGEKLDLFLDHDNELGMFALMMAWRQLVAGRCNLTQFFRRLLVRLDQRFGERQVTSFSPQPPSPSLFLDTDSDNEPYESHSPLHLPMNPLLEGALAHQANSGDDPLSSNNDMLAHLPPFTDVCKMTTMRSQEKEEEAINVEFDALIKRIEEQMVGKSKKKKENCQKKVEEEKKKKEETRERKVERKRSPSKRKQTDDDDDEQDDNDENEIRLSKKSRASTKALQPTTKRKSRSSSGGKAKQREEKQASENEKNDNHNTVTEFNGTDSEYDDDVNNTDELLQLLTIPYQELSVDGADVDEPLPSSLTDEPQLNDSEKTRRVRANQQQQQLTLMSNNSDYYLDRAWDHRRVLLLDMAMLVRPVRHRVGRRRSSQRNAIHSVDQAASLLGITQGVATWRKLRAVGEMLVKCEEFNTVMRDRLIQRPSVSKLKLLFTVERFRAILPQLLVKWKQLNE